MQTVNEVSRLAGISVRTLHHYDAKEVRTKIKELQAFITENYYNCTDEILKNLSQMYICDERMKCNIDKAGGEGTAQFVNQAVAVYCGG